MGIPIIVQYKVKAPAEKVWKALTDKDEMKSWYFDIPDFELEIGKIFNFYEPGEERKFHHQGKILKIIPNKKLEHSWSYPDLSDGITTVTWELRQQGEETNVTLIHNDIDQLKELGANFSREAFADGWNGILKQSLKPYLEN
ncbi:MAG: SRPBCC domain-containing protein [Chryseobacterium sp.]|uniref:SRPBCC family protein n=1 Tax=Chryseobacterium sp. TaxID=1871047 RepID=UPI000DB71854|nr:SRPBCC domain-containing protein [Chryseobacterium sp.]MPS65350.1 SRPBCC domain-containing protein [Chryseobacterium sp.]PZU16802.1 MAG: SRPBCC domain-containing protein [Chryseobacterium sp.]